ncbi:hypothetical protein SNEBB_004562 [Seison nebaliae]|nr:hypothetical protein SNEBB_004562 [Seison nebaliae]
MGQICSGAKAETNVLQLDHSLVYNTRKHREIYNKRWLDQDLELDTKDKLSSKKERQQDPYNYMTTSGRVEDHYSVAWAIFLSKVEDNILYSKSAKRVKSHGSCVPERFDINDYEDIYLLTSDFIVIHAYFLKTAPEYTKNTFTVLYLHGNSGHIGHRLHLAKALVEICKFNVFLLEYRGYGKSDGNPTEAGLYLDAQAGLDHLIAREDVNNSKILVFGRSLGGAVAIQLTSFAENSRKYVVAVIIENTFTSFVNIVKNVLNHSRIAFLGKMIDEKKVKAKFKSIEKVKLIQCGMLFLSGKKDFLTPTEMMGELYDASTNSFHREMYRFDSGEHDNLPYTEFYYEIILLFVLKCYYMKFYKLKKLKSSSEREFINTHFSVYSITDPTQLRHAKAKESILTLH